MRVRPAEIADAVAIVPLLDQLGYVVAAATLAQRLATTAVREDAAWVAVDGPGDEVRVVGFAAGHRSWPFELESPVAELTALVVAEDRRRHGTGRRLVAAFEAWATAHGCARVSVATSFERPDAHRFYEGLGYGQLARKYEKNP